MTTRHISAWCDRCATRVSIATEETGDADLDDEPCPCCAHGRLRGTDLLDLYGEVPAGGWAKEDEPALHAAWRKRRETERT